jgi:hypothetical protein
MLSLKGEGGNALALTVRPSLWPGSYEGVDERGVGGGECEGHDGVAPGG